MTNIDINALTALIAQQVAAALQTNPQAPLAPAPTPLPPRTRAHSRTDASQPRGRADASQAKPQAPITLHFVNVLDGTTSDETLTWTFPHIGETGTARFGLCLRPNGQRFRLYEKTLARLQQGDTVVLRLPHGNFRVRAA